MIPADLFQYRYPDVPGHRDTDTSRAAADSMRESATTLRGRCLAVLRVEPLTADEAAAKLGVSILAIRPRCTELARMGLVRDTGRRRMNESGRSAIVWEVMR